MLSLVNIISSEKRIVLGRVGFKV